MSEPEYRASCDSQGATAQIVRCESGETVPIDTASQSYCDLLAWASRQSVRPDGYEQLEDDCYVFADTQQLVAHLKQYGHMLYVEPQHPGIEGPHKYVVPRRNSGNKQQVPGGRIYRLFRAIELPRGTGQVAPGGIASGPLNVWIAEGMYEALNASLHNEMSDVRCLSSWPVRRCFVYIDVSDFSRYEPGQQALIVNALTSITRNEVYWQSNLENLALSDLEAQLCIGDGYILCFKSTVRAVYYAARLASHIELFVAQKRVPLEFHFRIGIHAGLVYRFWDQGRNNWNYVGDGINGGNRVLAVIGKDADDLVFLSHEVRAELTSPQSRDRPYPELLDAMLNRGRRSDKHGRMWRVYELGHTRIGR